MNILGIPESGATVVCAVLESWEKVALGPHGIIERGWKADQILQAACDWVHERGYGTVVIHDRMAIETAPLVVPERVRLHCSESGVLANKLDDASVPFIQFEPEATAGWLRLNAQGRAGITFGRRQTQANSFASHIYLFEVGAGQTGIETRGYQVTGNWWHVSGDGNNDCLGFDFQHTSDLFINSAIAVGTANAARFGTNEHVFIPALDCDSGSETAVSLGEVHDMQLGCTVWCNASADESLEWQRAIDIHPGGHTHTLTLDTRIMRSGRTGLRLANIDAATIRAVITNETAYPAAPTPMETGLIYDDGVGDDVTVKATISPDMQTAMVDGTPAGSLNGTAYEAAGAGNPPTATKWPLGRRVENIDDNTIWLKTSTAGFRQLS
jgi:hypothetical protein